MLEILISVHDKGKWIADLDVLEALSSSILTRLPTCAEVQCTNEQCELRTPKTRVACIDDWLKLAEGLEERMSIVRSA